MYSHFCHVYIYVAFSSNWVSILCANVEDMCGRLLCNVTEQCGLKVMKQSVLSEGTCNSAVYLEIGFYPIICYMCTPNAW